MHLQLTANKLLLVKNWLLKNFTDVIRYKPCNSYN